MFQKAVKAKSFLRLGIAGPTGSGKTKSALRIATGISQAMRGEKIAVIDTEHGRASYYSDEFKFDTAQMHKPYEIDKYIRAIKEAQDEGYKILVIDSLTHAWQELLEEVEKLGKTKYRNNSFRAWSEGTPKQNKFVEAFLGYEGHLIATMRSKMEYALEKDEKTGKNVVNKLGMGIEQRKGLEYEFLLFMEGTTDHYFTVSKDNTGKFQDKIIEKPDEEMGKELYEWLNTEGSK